MGREHETGPGRHEHCCWEAHGHGAGGAVVSAFLFGAMVGAAVGLLVAPEPGPVLRGRLAKGARKVGEEWTDAAADAGEALAALGKDAEETLKRTATRLSEALDATKVALRAMKETPKGSSRK